LRIASSIILALLFLGLSVFALNGQPAKAVTGEIIINPNGTISSPVIANITVSNNVYIFTGNNYLPIVVERSNIIINGGGYMLQAPGQNGLSLSSVNNVTIKDATITNSRVGIYLFDSDGNVLYGNNVTANSELGIELDSSSGNLMSDNNVANNSYATSLEDGVFLGFSSDNNVLSRNNVTANGGLIGIDIWSSDNNTLSDNKVTANVNGLGLGSYSSGNVLSGNNVTANTYVGIALSLSSGNVLSGNNVTANGNIGINIVSSSGNVLSGNNVASNWMGIWLISSSDNNTLSGNNVTANSSDGIYLYSSSSNNKFFHNHFNNNTQQVSSDGSPNIWDDGYPSGGNYWSDYLTRYPNATEIDHTGIGSTPYVINANNTDHYPLMKLYSAPSYTLTITASVGGTTTSAPGTYSYTVNSSVQVTAIPEAEYSFDYWKLDSVKVGSANPYAVLMNTNHTLEAIFSSVKPSVPVGGYSIPIQRQNTTSPPAPYLILTLVLTIGFMAIKCKTKRKTRKHPRYAFPLHYSD
jgi:parallel beta-helix repeat protein